MKTKSFLPVTFILFILGACQPVRYLTIDLTDPGKENLPAEIQSLTLINRAVDKRFTDDPKDSIQVRFYESQFNLDTVIYDTQAADTLLKALGNLLYESGRFDVVIPENRYPMKDTLNPYSSEMNWETAEELNHLFNTDAVLSLDFYKTFVQADFGYKKIMDHNSFEFVPFYFAKLRVTYIANFRLYYPKNKKSLLSYFLVDTLKWDGADFEIRELFRGLTKVKNALSEAAISAAMNLSGRIAPEWNSYRRAYFASGNQLLTQTRSLVVNNEWDEAISVWTNMLNNAKSNSLKSKIEFNIALAYEMKGDLDEAIRWGLKSYNSSYRLVTYDYLKILEKRRSMFNQSNENKP